MNSRGGSPILRIIQSITALLVGVSAGQVGINPCSILQVAFTMMTQQPGFTLAMYLVYTNQPYNKQASTA
jgi:hypothetical protein